MAQAGDNNDNVEHMNQQEPSLLEQVVQRIQVFLTSVDAAEQQVDHDVARRLLEMANGNLDVVESLYYDHYFASLERGNLPDNNRARAAEDDPNESPRRVRRRLERDLQEQQGNENNEAADNHNNDDDDESVESIHPQEDNEQGDQNNNNNDNALALLPPVHEDDGSSSSSESESSYNEDDDNDDNEEEAGAAVSDDEGPRARRRRPRRRRIRIQHEHPNNAEGGEGPLLRNISMEAAGQELEQQQGNAAARKTSIKKQKEEQVPEEDEDDDIGEDFLQSDFAWIFENGSNVTTTSKPPVLLLWGDLVAKQKAENESNNAANNNALPQGSNVVAQDDDDDDDDADGDSKPAIPKEGIPKTWLRAGFKSSTCGTGLIAEPPDEEENSLSRWRQSGSRNIAPPPYHCLGVTALLSVVTALMYSGPSIQGSEVNCNAARKPFANLSEEERKREFDGRLVDALSSLVWIAAQASLKRKKRALAKRKLNDATSVNDKAQEQVMERKLQLIPTCRFEKDNGTGDTKIVEGRQVKIATSLTRMEDIRAYVVSTLRSFTKKGGCALFLETIVCIHGKTCVEKMVRNARRKAGLTPRDVLIECECEARQKKLSQASSPAFGASITDTEPTEEPVPLDHTCISTELISLLLTGEVRTSLQKWTAGPLNVGILTDSAVQVDSRLLHPEKPVWIIRGDTCYSVAWFDGNKEHFEAVSRGACAGTLTHWNPWFGHRHKSTMRLLAARGEWKPPVFSKAKSAESEKKSVTASILARRKEQLSHVVSSDEHENSASRITKEEIDQVKINPEDKELYPGNYRQWRFDMGHSPTPIKAEEDVKIGLASPSSSCGAKEHVHHWIPYFRLNEHQQQVVAMKVSPAIKRILWSRWPGATIDRFTPEDDETPPAV